VCLKNFSVFNIRKRKNTKRKERKRLQKPKGRAKGLKRQKGRGFVMERAYPKKANKTVFKTK